MFANLMRSELSRLRYRRRAWGSLILMMLVGLVLPSFWVGSIREPTPREQLLTEVDFARMLAVGECQGCTLADVQGWWSFGRAVRDGIGGSTIFLALIAFMVVVAYVVSDFSSGAMATQLTFTPRRSAVLVARTLACGVLGALLMLAGVIATTTVTITGFLALNGLESIGTAPGLLDVVSGAVVYGAFLGIIAALVAFIIPSAPLAMVTTTGVLIVNAFVDWSGIDHLPSWVFHLLPIHAGQAMLLGNVVVTDPYVGEVTTVISRGQSIVYHLFVVIALFAVAAVLFQRRDVKG